MTLRGDRGARLNESVAGPRTDLAPQLLRQQGRVIEASSSLIIDRSTTVVEVVAEPSKCGAY
jgi:hypothetical protein